MAAPRPSRRHYEALGQRHGEVLARCVEAFNRLEHLYNPAAWPPEDQVWVIARLDEADEAMAVIFDSQRGWEGETAA